MLGLQCVRLGARNISRTAEVISEKSVLVNLNKICPYFLILVEIGQQQRTFHMRHEFICK